MNEVLLTLQTVLMNGEAIAGLSSEQFHFHRATYLAGFQAAADRLEALVPVLADARHANLGDVSKARLRSAAVRVIAEKLQSLFDPALACLAPELEDLIQGAAQVHDAVEALAGRRGEPVTVRARKTDDAPTLSPARSGESVRLTV